MLRLHWLPVQAESGILRLIPLHGRGVPNVSSLIGRVVCWDKVDLWVILVSWRYVCELLNREPLSVAPRGTAGACHGEKK